MSEPGAMDAAARELVFISYSHVDASWLARLKTHLKPFERRGAIVLWDDQRIQAGAQWRAEIVKALARARVAVLLVSPDFLASDFIAEHELPRLLGGEKDLTVVWIPVRPSGYAATELANYQAAFDPRRTLAEMDEAEADRALVAAAEKIERAFRAGSSSEREADARDVERVNDVSRGQSPPSRAEIDQFRPPIPPLVFVGRENELAQINRGIEEGDVVLIQGLAGLGKSSLASYFASQSVARFPDGILWIKVNEILPSLGLAHVVERLGGKANDAGEVQYNRALYLWLATGKRLLVVLDNAETLEQVRLLLPDPRQHGLKVLITTRDAGLARRIEGLQTTMVAISNLNSTAALELMQAIAGREWSGTEKAIATRLLLRLGFHTLAIKLISLLLADNPALSVRELAIEVESRIERLATDGSEETQNRSVVASLDLSLRHLSAEEQRSFLSLSAFGERAFDLEAARAVTMSKNAAELTTRLCRLSLLESAGQRRWRLHPLVARYTQYRAGPIEYYESVFRYVQYYLVRVVVMREEMKKNREAALTTMLSEYSHLAAAHHACSALLVVDLGRPLRAVLNEKSPNWILRLLGLAGPPRSRVAPAILELSWAIGEMLTLTWLPAWPECFEAAVVAARCERDLEAEGYFMFRLAREYATLGRVLDAERCYRESTRLIRKRRNAQELAMALSDLSSILAQAPAKLDEALAVAQQACALAEEHEHEWGRALRLIIRNNIGQVLLRQGKRAQAIAEFQQAIALSPGGDPGLPVLLSNLALALVDQGKLQAALEQFQLAVKMLRDSEMLPSPPQVASIFHEYACTLDQAGQKVEGANWHHRAWHLAVSYLGAEHPDTQEYAKHLSSDSRDG